MVDTFPVEHALEIVLASTQDWTEAAQQAALDALQQGRAFGTSDALALSSEFFGMDQAYCAVVTCCLVTALRAAADA